MSDKKRIKNFCCFVCDTIFETLEEFRSHIVTSHEEGTDFIICPCETCKIPVRDLRTHMALKHPEQKIPDGYPTRPVILRDSRFKKKRNTAFKQGNFFSQKNNKNLFFRSGLESEFYKCLEKSKQVSKYAVESLEIEYVYEGKLRRYIPDILVEYCDGKKELWEIKPKNQTKIPKNLAKWKAADDYCRRRNIEFVVLTERGLRVMRKKLL
jgi:hypothetical protein